MTTENKNRTKLKNPLKSFFNYQWIIDNITFFLFLSGLAILYIANGHRADQIIRKINATQTEIKELQFNYKTLKSEVMFKSGEEQIVQAAAPLQLKLNNEMPYPLEATINRTTQQ
ncbi:MAG: FtsL-like putative cell division protein [Chitinophagia bacterium]|jgi:cell division protein FtsL